MLHNINCVTLSQKLIVNIMIPRFVSFRVEFIGGPYNGAYRYYSKHSTAMSVARRYVNKYVDPGRIFSHPACEVVCINSCGRSLFCSFV